MKEHTGQVIVQAPTSVANFILNEKRKNLTGIEARHSVPILILSNEHMQRPKFEIERLRKADVSEEPSYTHVHDPEEDAALAESAKPVKPVVGPAVSAISPNRPAPIRVEKEDPAQVSAMKPKAGKFGQFLSRLFSTTAPASPASKPAEPVPAARPSVASTPAPAAGARSAAKGRPSGERSDRSSNRGRPARGKPSPAAATDDKDPEKRQQGRNKTGKKKRVRKSPSDANRAVDARVVDNRVVDSRAADGRVVDGNLAAPDQPRPPQALSDQPQETGESQPVQAGERDPKAPAKSRRRRSRYKTGGGKSREDQLHEGQAHEDRGANVPAHDSPGPNGNVATPAPSAPAGLPPSANTASSSPQGNAPAVAVSRDDKGVYTLKPAEPPARASAPPVEHFAPPAPAQSGNDQ